MGFMDFLNEITESDGDRRIRKAKEFKSKLNSIGLPEDDPVLLREYRLNASIEQVNADIGKLEEWLVELKKISDRDTSVEHRTLSDVWAVEHKIDRMKLFICDLQDLDLVDPKKILEAKLQEIESLREQKLISENEYNMMRSKALKKYMHEL